MKTWEEIETNVVAWCGDRKNTTLMAMIAAKEYHEAGSAIIETGTYRGYDGDGMSTILFGMMAETLGEKLISVDIKPAHISASVEKCKAHEVPVNHICEDSVGFLSKYPGPISFLYLDSFDYDFGVPINCQLHNLAEAGAAIGKMCPRSVILIDDSNLPEGGKPGHTIPWLIERGWKLVAKEYQVLLVNWDFDPELHKHLTW